MPSSAVVVVVWGSCVVAPLTSHTLELAHLPPNPGSLAVSETGSLAVSGQVIYLSWVSVFLICKMRLMLICDTLVAMRVHWVQQAKRQAQCLGLRKCLPSFISDRKALWFQHCTHNRSPRYPNSTGLLAPGTCSEGENSHPLMFKHCLGAPVTHFKPHTLAPLPPSCTLCRSFRASYKMETIEPALFSSQEYEDHPGDLH